MSGAPRSAQAGGRTGAAPVRRRLGIVVNADSGGWHGDGQRARIERTLEEAGADADLRIVHAAEVDDAMRAAYERAPEALCIAGGDGTIRAAVEVAAGGDVPIAILPLGTMNLVAGDLGVAAPLENGLHIALTGRATRIDVARVNGRPFLHSSVLGVVPRVGRHRETMRRDADPLSFPRRLFMAVKAAVTTPKLDLTLESDQGVEQVRTFALAITNNPLRGELLDPYGRERLDEGVLGVYRSNHRGRIGLARLLASLGAGVWWLDEQFHVSRSHTLIVRAPGSEIAVSDDGEIEMLALPLVYEVDAKSLPVITPRPPGEMA